MLKGSKISIAVFIAVSFILSLYSNPIWASKKTYHKKLYKSLKKKELTKLPDIKNYPQADGIVIYESIQKPQFYGYYSLWDINYSEIHYKLWEIINPNVPRFKKLVVKLGTDGELTDFMLNIFTPDRQLQKFKKKDISFSQVNPTKGTISLPDLVSKTIIEMKVIVKHKQPLYWDKLIIHSPDPIIYFRYGFSHPVFHKQSPTKYYEKITELNPFFYRFRAFDNIQKKFLKVQEDDKGFFFVFNNIPAFLPKPHGLPKANSSSMVSFALNQLIIKNPIAKFDKEKDVKLMQLPANIESLPNKQKIEKIKSAGSPAGFKLPFENWSEVYDYVLYDMMNRLKTSKLFAEKAKEMIGETTIPSLKTKKIYKKILSDFSCTNHNYMKPNITVKDLEHVLSAKKGSSLEIGFVFWGLLQNLEINSKIGLAFSRDKFLGKFDRKFPIPVNFNEAIVFAGKGKRAKYYYPVDASVKAGKYPPELDGADVLWLNLKSKEELKNEPKNQTDPKSPYIKIMKRTRIKADWQLLDFGSPTVNKIVSKIAINVAQDGSLSNKALISFTGHEETLVLRELLGKNKTEIEKYVSKWFNIRAPQAKVTKTAVKNLHSMSKNLTFELEFELPLKLKANNLEISFDFYNENEALFYKADENLNSAFVLPFRAFVWDDFMVTFEKGWKVTKSPEKKQFKSKEGMAAINLRQNKIQFNYQRGFSQVQIFTKEKEMGTLTDFYKKIREFSDDDVLTLEKI